MIRCIQRWRLTMAVASLAVAGCEASEAPPAPPASDPAIEPPEPRQDLPDEQRSPDLLGAWIVESVATPGPALQDRSWEMVLLVGVRQLELLSQCVTIGPFDYGRRAGGGIAVGPVTVAPGTGRATPPPPPQCARALSPAEGALPRLLLAAREVRREEDGTVSLAGPAGTVTLRRPKGALANPRGQAPPPRVPPPLGAWRFVTVDGRTLPPGEGMELLLRPSHIEWRSGCVSEVRELRSEGHLLLPGPSDPFPVCERGRSESERAAERLFGAPVAMRMAADGRLVLRGSGLTAELVPLVS